MNSLDVPVLDEGAAPGPNTGYVFTIDGTFVAPADYGVGADFIVTTPQVGPALPQISYGAPAGAPTLDHLQGIANDYPGDTIYD